MATKANLIVDQGTDYTTTITMKDVNGRVIDLSDYTGEGKMRKYYTSANSVSLDISLAVNGQVTIGLPANTTNNMDFGRYVYDVEVTHANTGLISRVVEGIITIKPGVTY